MKQQINEIKRMQQLAGVIKEYGDVSSEDFQIEKVNRIIAAAIRAITPDVDKQDELFDFFERTKIPEFDTFAIADKLTSGEITTEDIKAIVAKAANQLGSIDEGIGKTLGTAALGAALAFGSPKGAAAQSPQQIEKSVFNVDIASMDDEQAGQTLFNSYSDNPFTADMWSKLSDNNETLFKRIKFLINDFMEKKEDVQTEELKALGRKYKNTPAAAEFLDREKAIKAAKTKTLEETINEALKRFRKGK